MRQKKKRKKFHEKSKHQDQVTKKSLLKKSTSGNFNRKETFYCCRKFEFIKIEGK